MTKWDPDDVLQHFYFDGKIKGSGTKLIPHTDLDQHFPGEDRGLVLEKYHPAPDLELKVEIRDDSAEHPAVRNKNINHKWLQATYFGAGWGNNAQRLFASMQFVPSPTGLCFLVPKKLDPTVTQIGNWELVHARLEETEGPPDDTGNVSLVKKVVLCWTTQGFNEYVYTCWLW